MEGLEWCDEVSCVWRVSRYRCRIDVVASDYFIHQFFGSFVRACMRSIVVVLVLLWMTNHVPGHVLVASWVEKWMLPSDMHVAIGS